MTAKSEQMTTEVAIRGRANATMRNTTPGYVATGRFAGHEIRRNENLGGRQGDRKHAWP